MENSLKKSATPRELLMMMLATIGLFGFFLKMVYSPNADKIKDLGGQTQTVLTEEKELTQQVELLKKQKQKKEENQAPIVGNTKVKILNGALKPEISDTPTLIKKLSSSTFVEALVIDTITYKPELTKPTHKEVPIIIQAHGTFNKLNGFLKNLDELGVLFSVDSVNIATDPIIKGEMSVNIGATFYLIEGINAEKQSYQL